MLDQKKKTIEMCADREREQYIKNAYGIVNIFRDCRDRGYKLIRYPIGEENVLGFAQLRDGDKIIFSNSSSRLSREIFTVAHELGHHVLHLSEDKSEIIDDNFDGTSDEEEEANHFAISFLAPKDLVRKYVEYEMPNSQSAWAALDIAKMMIAFNLSFEACLNRLQNLSLLDSVNRHRLTLEKSANSVSNYVRILDDSCNINKASEVIAIPDEFLKWVLYNYENRVIPQETLEKSLNFLKLKPSDVGIDTTKKNADDLNLDDLLGRLDD